MSEFLQGGKPPLILASSSKVRARMLEAAGLAFIVEPPGLDEHVMRQAIGGTGVAEPAGRCRGAGPRQGRGGERACAREPSSSAPTRCLPSATASSPSPTAWRRRGASCSISRGKSHTLHTAVALATNGETVWAHSESSTLTMRKLTPQFIGRYLAAAGEEVLSSVGAYQLEGLGIQLFEKIDGDYFSILGLPLLPLLDALRREGAIEG